VLEHVPFKEIMEEPMLSNGNEELTVEQAKALLGPPPLMLNESEEEYWKWWTAFVKPERPKRFFAWLEVNEVAHKEWERKSLRQFGPALVKRALIPVLSSLLQGLYDGVSLKVAKDYFGNDATAQREARRIVASFGITEEQIVAEAMVKRGDEMLILDRMDGNRASASRHLRKAIERRAETDRIPPEQTGDQA
jgi:hypothetical protein